MDFSNGKNRENDANLNLILDNFDFTKKMLKFCNFLPSGQFVKWFTSEFNGRSTLGNQGHDGDSSMTANDGAVDISGIQTFQFSNESVGPDNVKGCDTKDLVGVVLASLLEHLCGYKIKKKKIIEKIVKMKNVMKLMKIEYFP